MTISQRDWDMLMEVAHGINRRRVRALWFGEDR